MTSIWLQRSGGQPLNIILGRMDPENFAGTEKENPALDALLHSQAHRWNDVKLIVTKSMLSFLKNIPKGLPMLHTLHIDGPDKDLGIASLNNFIDASALRVLTLEKRVSLESSQWLPEFPWAQLTTFNLMGGRNYSYTSQDACNALRQTVNLRYCTMAIKASWPVATNPPSPSSIRLLDLISLNISALTWENAEDIINVLTLPALTELKIISTQSDAAAFPECVAALITRSGCQLQHLSFTTYGVSFNHDGLLELLKLTPTLSEFELQFFASISMDNSLMDLLTHKPDHAAGLCCLLPNLASIRLTVHSAFSYEAFLDLLSSRRHVGACNAGGVGLAQLRVAALITWGDVSASGRRAHHLPRETFEGFRELRERGLDLYVDGGTKRSLEKYFAPGEEEDDSNSEEEEEEEDQGEDREEDQDDDEDYHP
ncbi:hypothetical protein FIBSPDRAFT_1052609 [Athelia psychrophila]|uniref:RNI-like protein n=1 Tax=Athelia psychrophila TaxID=1759441 RepID=A0A165X221_9AGAM|nr:hypothetical protein FIBSPDRAFT_1052609 [Fibularhizoctonia sp. CBS 109695]